MSIDYIAWLRSDNAERVVLIEAEHLSPSGTEYFATRPFISGSSDTPVNQPYDDYLDRPEVISGINARMDVGNLSLVNNGDLDAWFDYVWQGQALRLYLGAPDWARDDYLLIVDGINGGITSPARDRVAFSLFDQRKLLDVQVQTNRLSDGTLIPLCYGSVFNVKPILKDAATLRYKLNDGAVTDIPTVRDSGLSVSKTNDLSNGEFTLSSAPAGDVTCDVVAPNATAADVVTALAARVSGITVDTTNLTAFANTDPIGLYVSSEQTVGALIDEVMQTVGGVYRFDELGKLQIVRIDLPTGDADLEMDVDDVELRGMTLQSREYPRSTMSLGYERNWTPQDAVGLAGAVTAANRDLYEKEYQIVSGTNGGIVGMDEIPNTMPTLFTTNTGATNELNRRLAMRTVSRHVYGVSSFAGPSQSKIGDVINLTHPRFGFASGKKAVLIGKRWSPKSGRTVLELWA